MNISREKKDSDDEHQPGAGLAPRTHMTCNTRTEAREREPPIDEDAAQHSWPYSIGQEWKTYAWRIIRKER